MFRVVQLRKYSPNSRCRPSSCHLASAKGTNKGRFCRAKAFIRNTAADRLTASWSAIDKQGNEKKNVCDPEVCSGVSLCGRRVVELNF